MASETAVLLGAGASRDAGIPVTTEMTRQIYDLTSGGPFADREATHLGRALATVIGGLTYQKGIRGENPYKGLNVEEVFASVQMLANRSDIEAAPFIGSWHNIIEELEDEPATDYDFDNLYRATRDNIAEELRKIATRSSSPLRKIEKEYGKQVNKKNPKLEWGKWIGNALAEVFTELERSIPPHRSRLAFRRKMGGIIRRDTSPRLRNIFERLSEHMILSLRDLVWLQEGHDVSYLKPLLDLETEQLKIYSLNYDNAVEQLCQQNGISYTVGITKSGAIAFDPRARIHLTKLHGSIDWVEIDSNRPLPVKGFRLVSAEEMDKRDQMQRPAIIFGQGNKLTSEGPYLELLRDFSIGLEEHHNLLVVGYSFRDAHVNQYIAQWFDNDPIRQIVILSGPNFLDEAQGNPFVKNLRRYGGARVKVVEETTAKGLSQAISKVKDMARH
jgi:SIR2-like domain